MDDKPKVKVLVVDDRHENLVAMGKLLKPLGAEVHKVDSGEAALSKVLHHHFAVILLDVQMPGMDGFETATLLHSNKQTASIPIIFVTAINKEQAYINQGYQAGAVDYLPKPINTDILLGKVKVFLQLEAQRIELEDVSRQLRWISQKNKLLLDHAGEGIAGLDPDGRITFINPTACAMLGGTEERLLGKHISQFIFNTKDDDEALQQWQVSQIRGDTMVGGGVYQTSDRHLWTLSRSRFAAEYNMAAIVNDRQEVQGGVLLFQDITERKKLENQLIQMAKYDSLTGLANRTLFREFLGASLARSQRRGKSTAVMYLDLDHFKEINDTLGHDAGDRLLKSVSGRLQACVREGDLVARLGGDEFAIILDDVAKASDVRLVAEKMLAKVREPHDLNGENRQVGISMGIATSTTTDPDAKALLKAADQAMYIAKKNGRNNYCLASELNSEEHAGGSGLNSLFSGR